MIGDLEGIMAVENACFPPGERYDESLFRRRLSGPPYDIAFERKYFVATSYSSKIVGYAEAAIQDSGTVLFGTVTPFIDAFGKLDRKVGALISIGVLPKLQGKGIGSRLVDARLAYLQENGIHQVFAQAWPNGGFPHLAPKLGFTLIPGWEGRKYEDGTTQKLYYKRI